MKLSNKNRIELDKDIRKIVKSAVYQIAKPITTNWLYEFSKFDQFTASTVITRCRGDSTGPDFQKSVTEIMRDMAKSGTPFKHSSGVDQKLYVYMQNSDVGRTNRPTNLYKMKAA